MPEIELSKRFLPRFGAPDPHGYTGGKLRAEEHRSWLEHGENRAAFYIRCYEIVRSIAPDEIRGLMGDAGERAERELLEERLPQLR